VSDPSTKRVERPAICLNMIVRNEAHIVTEVLDAVAPYLSTWVIVDTGSDDGTQDLIRTHMDGKGIRGELYERPWRSFGHNRTEALSLAQGHADYIWVIDADDTIVGAPDFTQLAGDVVWLRYIDANAYTLWRPQVFRDGLDVHYERAIHEHAVWDYDSCVDTRLGGDYHLRARSLGARSLDTQKFERDRDLLLAEVERDPEDARSVFYLAQTYYCMGDLANARKWYGRRAEMGGWEQDGYFARWRLAQAMSEAGEPWPDVQDAYLKAWEFRPTRAEPLYAIARRFRIDARYQLGYVFAKRAAQIPFPDDDVIFVSADVYAWRAIDEQAVCASWIEKHAEAFTLWRQLLAQPDIPDDDRARIAANRDVCAPKMIDAASSYPEELVRSLQRPIPDPPGVVVSLVAGPDRTRTEHTLNSFLRCCTDVSRVGRFLVIDVGLSAQDREIICARYGFLEFVPPGTQPGDVRAQIDAQYWLHLGQDWRFFAPEDLITRLTAVLEAEPEVFQVGINFTDAANLTGTCAPEPAVRRTPEAGRYLLTDLVAHGPAMFDTARLDRSGGMEPIAELGRRAAAAGLRTASLDEVLCIATAQSDESTQTLYNSAFYSWQAAGSTASSRVIVPMLAALTHPRSVLDVGCGVGGWVGTWLDSGADAVGVDGDYVPRDQLCIPADRFINHDLSTPLDLGRRFDLVTCLEVAEHLPEQDAQTIVDSLCQHADVIAFSAAVPGQGGTGHVNERWPTFWAELFANRGYRPYDLLRGQLWWDERCEWWYRQNLLLYATEEVAHQHGWPELSGPLDLVHPDLFVLRTSG
jgi:tetratricopeptide (TPR) repeat protein